jgi:Carboxypeptidase regulatory-like domain
VILVRSTVVVLLALLYALAGSVAPTHAQAPETAAGDKGSIVGTVLDTSGAAVVGAVITAVGSADQRVGTTTNEKGEYRIDGLVPGIYKLIAETPGFKDFTKEGVTVATGEPVRVDINLTPASVTQKVEVSAGGTAQVEQETSQIAGTITNKEVTTYALNGRNFTQLIALAPGVSNQTGQDEALVGVKGSVNYSVNGGRVEYNTYDVDGGDILNASINRSSSTLIVYPSIDAIVDLQVLTSNYGAMYGRSASGTILATTKSGGTSFHGDLYFFARNNIFNARNFFDETPRAPLYQKYEPGGTIGGPLYIPGILNEKKNKTFFFFSEEYRHDKEPVEFNQAVPSAAERNCANSSIASVASSVACQTPSAYGSLPPGSVRFGSFSDVCPQTSAPGQPGDIGYFALSPGIPSPNGGTLPVYPDCPSIGQVNAGSPNSPYQTFAGNLVPISAQSAAILDTNVVPLPNSTTGCNSTIGSCYDASVSPLTTWREELFRIDQNFTNTQKLSFRYIHDAWSTQVPYVQWGSVHNSFPTVENNFTGPGLSLVAHYTSTIKSRLVNDLVMAYTSDHINLTDLAGPGVTNGSLARPAILDNAPCGNTSTCGMGYIFDNTANNFGGKLPGLVIGGNNAVYGGNGFDIDPGYLPWHHSNPTYSPRDDATLSLGKHLLQFGALFIIAQRNEVNPPVGANTGDIQGLATFSNVNSRGSSGNAFADFLTGEIQSFTQDSSQAVYHNTYRIAEPYLQDNWKILPNLTLNLGVRLSIFGLYAEKYHQSFNWVPSEFSTGVASSVVVDQATGRLLTVGGQSIPIDPSNPSPLLLNGIVQCGVSTYADGQKVPPGCMTNHLLNPAPRIGVAWDPFKDGKTSVRAGYGIFYEHGTGNEANTGSLEGSSGPEAAGGVLSMTQYYPGGWGCIGDLLSSCGYNPSFPCYAGNCSRSAFPLNVTAIPTKAVWPYAQQWSLSVQRQLPWHLLGSLAYVGSKGTHLTTELQVNQLLPLNPVDNPFLPGQPLTNFICLGEGAPFFTVNGTNYGPGSAPYQNLLAACAGMNPIAPSANSIRIPGYAIAPAIGQIYSLQNIANSNYNAMQFTLRRTQGPLTLGVSYTYSHSIDDSSDRFSQIFVNAYNIAQNRASSDFDQRQLLNISYIYQLPLEKWYRDLNFADDEPTNQIAGKGISDRTNTFLRGWEWSGITIVSTGTPFSVINGGSPTGISTDDNAGVLSVIGPGSYPDVTTPTSSVNSRVSSLFGPLLGNPGQFVAPQGLTYGDAGRNFLRNPGRLNFDMSVTKTVTFREDRSLQFRFETFNVFNHTQFRIYDPTNPGNPGNNVVNCYGGPTSNYSAGDPSCLASSSFLHPVDAHRPRTIQLGVKYLF